MASCRGVLHRLPLRLPLPSSYVSASRISSLSRHSPPVPRFQIHGMYSEPKLKGTTQQKDEQLSNKWKIKMLYDGECPLCMREVNMLREQNQAYGTIKFVDISSEDFSPAENKGLDYKTVMGRIHAIQSDGTVYTDVEAFRRLYEEVGLGWVYVVTKYEPISTIANVMYKIWATYRLQLTGRPSLEEILELKKSTTAFRRLYEEVGLGWVYVVTKYEPISTIANVMYKIWATYRLQLTGRPSLEEILELKKSTTISRSNKDMWYLDSGCSRHMTGNKEKFVS